MFQLSHIILAEKKKKNKNKNSVMFFIFSKCGELSEPLRETLDILWIKDLTYFYFIWIKYLYFLIVSVTCHNMIGVDVAH